jgi:hypothetical protein
LGGYIIREATKKMNRMVKRFGKLITASFFVMEIGVIAFLLTPVFLRWNIDTDLPGVLIVDVGIVIYLIGLIRRNTLGRIKRIAFITVAAVLSIPILFAIVSLIYFLITGKALGG